jgi:predicted amidophosphoribosyltransferase
MLTRIDDLTFPDHYRLDITDECYFVGEYTARAGYNFSATNDLIHNLKKGMERKDRPEWRCKIGAIATASLQLRNSLNPDYVRVATFVPVPPCRTKNDPLYDDRMVQVLRQFGDDVDVRELVVQLEGYDASHAATNSRPGPDELYQKYQIDEALVRPIPRSIAVVDDVLTTGAHFKAMQKILSETFPSVPLIGVFVARRVPGAI